MRAIHHLGVASIVVAATIASPCIAVASSPAPKPPATTARRAGLVQYFAQLRRWTRKNPRHLGRRPLLDYLLTAGALHDRRAVHWARRKLIALYPDTLAGRFALSDFPSATKFRSFLRSLLRAVAANPNAAAKRRIGRLMRRARHIYGDGIFDDGEYGVLAALISRYGHHFDTMRKSSRGITKASHPFAFEAASLSADSALSPLAKLQGLRKLEKAAPRKTQYWAVLFKYLYDSVPKRLRRKPAAERLAAENALTRGDFLGALKPLTRLNRQQPTAWSLCEGAWCEGSAGHPRRAGVLTARVRALFPNGRWAKLSRRIDTICAGRDLAANADAEAAWAAASWMKNGIGWVNASMRTGRGPKSFRLSLAAVGHHFLSTAYVGGKLALAYEDQGAISRLYTARGGETLRASGTPAQFDFYLRHRGKRYALGLNLGLSTSQNVGFNRAIQRFLASKVLSSLKNLHAMMLHYARLGFIPVAPAARRGRLVYATCHLRPDQPIIDTYICTLFPNKGLCVIATPSLLFRVSGGRGGKKVSMTWPAPRKPVRRVQGTTIIISLIQAGGALYEEFEGKRHAAAPGAVRHVERAAAKTQGGRGIGKPNAAAKSAPAAGAVKTATMRKGPAAGVTIQVGPRRHVTRATRITINAVNWTPQKLVAAIERQGHTRFEVCPSDLWTRYAWSPVTVHWKNMSHVKVNFYHS